MFLAFKEIVYSRGRYRMVVAVVFLITYMVFFLSSLSVGLARLNRLALDQWGAQSVVLSEYANKNLCFDHQGRRIWSSSSRRFCGSYGTNGSSGQS